MKLYYSTSCTACISVVENSSFQNSGVERKKQCQITASEEYHITVKLPKNYICISIFKLPDPYDRQICSYSSPSLPFPTVFKLHKQMCL